MDAEITWLLNDKEKVKHVGLKVHGIAGLFTLEACNADQIEAKSYVLNGALPVNFGEYRACELCAVAKGEPNG